MTALDVPDFGGQAVCASGQYDPDLWFPESGFDGIGQARRAKQVCMGCPTRVECAEYAIPHSRLVGVWGGMSSKERDAARGTPRKVSRQPRKVAAA